ncbi:hypothetical protein OIU85_001175 [Salix viminalis]|uniref:Uncharacterized protein n=1 Tax=Salix viminalis TaxID=40686 RepID=A0A9Q0ZXW7_SALVM|nr:hypothetical protein OIU85_001175 [Salix viminalis]
MTVQVLVIGRSFRGLVCDDRRIQGRNPIFLFFSPSLSWPCLVKSKTGRGASHSRSNGWNGSIAGSLVWIRERLSRDQSSINVPSYVAEECTTSNRTKRAGNFQDKPYISFG